MVMTRSRSGVQIKKPTEVYTPEIEESGFADDYSDSEYDSDFDGSDLDTEDEMSCSEDDEEEFDEDETEMEGFIVDDDISETEYSDSDDT